MTGTTLLLIDAQADFHPGGSLAIPTAGEDAKRITDLIKNSITGSHGSSINNIIATLDSHHKMHIAHGSFWVDSETGKTHPDPFTLISSSDIGKDKKWVPRSDFSSSEMKKLIDASIFGSSYTKFMDDDNFDLIEYCKEYARQLENAGRFKLCIWPEHCLIGSPGHCIVPDILEAMNLWGEATGKSINFIQKGENLLTEMYSVLQAEVPIDESTSLNRILLNELLESDQLIVCGQAMSHCVNYTVRDIVTNWPEEKLSKILILFDCASAVPGFEGAAADFIKEMKGKGVQVCVSTGL